MRHQAGTPGGGRFRASGRREPETVLGLPVDEVRGQIQASVNYWGHRRLLGADASDSLAQEVWAAALAADARKTFDGENPCGYIHSLARRIAGKSQSARHGWMTGHELAVASRIESLAADSPPTTPADWDELYAQAVAEIGGQRWQTVRMSVVIAGARSSLPGGVNSAPWREYGRSETDYGSGVDGGPGPRIAACTDTYFEHELPDEAPKGEIWSHLTPDVRPIKRESIATRPAQRHRQVIRESGGAVAIARRLLNEDGSVDAEARAAFCAPWGALTPAEQIDVAEALVRNPSLANQMWGVALRAAERRAK